MDALAIRENVVRITFDAQVKYTRILDPGDASDIERYSITPMAGTIGLDSELVRPVFPAAVERARVSMAAGSVLDVTTDRMMSPHPTQYRIAVNGLRSGSGGLLDPQFTSKVFYGLHAGIPPRRADLAHRTRDIANQQNLAGMLDPLPHSDSLIFGTIPVDSLGDYAFDEGIDSFRKRVFRRLLTRKGSFAWMPSYGVGVPDQIGQLARASVRGEIASDAEAQIREDPETLNVSCVFTQSPQAPSVWYLLVRVRTKTGEEIETSVPFSPTGG